jgi:broad specificity phosphatase PhoE
VPRASSAPQGDPVQRAFDTAKQWVGAVGAGGNSLAKTTQVFGAQAMRQAQQLGGQAQQFGNGVVAQVNAQVTAVGRSSQARAVRHGAEAAAGVAWRAAKAGAPLNPIAAIAAPLTGALSRTPLGQQLAKTPVAQALERLDREFGGDLASVPTATRGQFLQIKPQDRAAAAAAAREIGAQRNLVTGDRSTESAQDASKSLFQGAVDGIRWVATGRRDDMDHLLNTTEHKLDRLQHDVMTGKVSASEARSQLAETTKAYYGEYTRVQNARVGQLDAGIAALQGVRSASETVATMTATTVAGPAGGVAMGTAVRDLNKAAYEWSAGAHGVAAPRESLLRLGIDAARGEKIDAQIRNQVLQSFGQSALSAATDTAVARFSAARTAGLMQTGRVSPGLFGTMRAAGIAQTEAHLLFRAPQAVGQAAMEAAQTPSMTLKQKAEHVGNAALGEVASLPFTYLGGGLGIGLDGGKTLASAARQMGSDALTGLADQATRTWVTEGRAMTVNEVVGTAAGTVVGGFNNFSQHPQTAHPVAEHASSGHADRGVANNIHGFSNVLQGSSTVLTGSLAAASALVVAQPAGAMPLPVPVQAVPPQPGHVWSTVNRAGGAEGPDVLIRRPVGGAAPTARAAPTVLFNINTDPRTPDRTYKNVQYQTIAPLKPSANILMVPNGTSEFGIGSKGWGSRESGAGFLRGLFNLNLQPYLIFSTFSYPLGPDSLAVTRGESKEIKISNPGGDYFVGGRHISPAADGGLTINRMGNSLRLDDTNFAEVYLNAPWAWFRPDTIALGYREVNLRGQFQRGWLRGESRNNLTPGTSSYLAAMAYTWGQDNLLKFNLAPNPLSGYVYAGVQAEVGAKLAQISRTFGRDGEQGQTGAYIVGGERSFSRAAWERSLTESGLTLRSESFVPEVGEVTSAVHAKVDAKLLSHLEDGPAIRDVDGKPYVALNDIGKALVRAGRSAPPAYAELAAVDPAAFMRLNEKALDHEAGAVRLGDVWHVPLDTWVNTGTRVALGVEGLAVPDTTARTELARIADSGARSAVLAPRPDADKVLSARQRPAPHQGVPSLKGREAKAANSEVQGLRWEVLQGTQDLRTRQADAVSKAIFDVERQRDRYKDLALTGKNWFQLGVDGVRDVVTGSPDAQIANLDRHLGDLQQLHADVMRSAKPDGVNDASIRLARIQQAFQDEYARVLRAQELNAQTGDHVIGQARNLAMGLTAAASVAALTVASRKKNSGISVGFGGTPLHWSPIATVGPLAAGAMVSATTGSLFDLATVAVGQSAPPGAQLSHFSPSYAPQGTPGARIGYALAGQPASSGSALNVLPDGTFFDMLKKIEPGLPLAGDAALGAATVASILIRRRINQRVDEFAVNRFGTTTGIGHVLNGGPKGLTFKGMAADFARFGGGAFGAAITGTLNPAALLAAGVANAVRPAGEARDGVFNFGVRGLAALASGASPAEVVSDGLVDTAKNLASRNVAELLHPDREIELESVAHYAEKYGVPENSIRFIVTARHGQSLTNFIHAYAGNVIQAAVRVLSPEGQRVPELSLHPLGRLASRARDAWTGAAIRLMAGPGSANGTEEAKALKGKPEDKNIAIVPSGGRHATLEGTRAEQVKKAQDLGLGKPDDSDERLIARLQQRADTLRMADDIGLLSSMDEEAALRVFEEKIFGGVDQLQLRQLNENRGDKEFKPEDRVNFQNPLTDKGQSQAVLGQAGMEAVLAALGELGEGIEIDISVSPVLRASETARLLIDSAKKRYPAMFEGSDSESAKVAYRVLPGARERGQGYLVFSVKPGEEHGVGKDWVQYFNTGNPLQWIRGMNSAVLDGLATAMQWPSPSANGKPKQVVEFQVPVTGADGKPNFDLRRAEIRLTDETGYETWNDYDKRVRETLWLGDDGLLKALQDGKHVVNVSHQYTIASLMRAIQGSSFNPLFQQSTKDVGAAVVNGKPHIVVVSMGPDRKPRVLEGGYVSRTWALGQIAARLEKKNVNDLRYDDPERLAHIVATAHAAAERDVVAAQDAKPLEVKDHLESLEGNERQYQHKLSSAQDPSVQAAYRMALDVTRLARMRLGDRGNWDRTNTADWKEEIRKRKHGRIADSDVGALEDEASDILAEYVPGNKAALDDVRDVSAVLGATPRAGNIGDLEANKKLVEDTQGKLPLKKWGLTDKQRDRLRSLLMKPMSLRESKRLKSFEELNNKLIDDQKGTVDKLTQLQGRVTERLEQTGLSEADSQRLVRLRDHLENVLLAVGDPNKTPAMVQRLREARRPPAS